jgi:polyisoprenoid-binding protein YceI
VKAVKLGLTGLLAGVALLGAVSTGFLRPPAQAPAPIQDVALAQNQTPEAGAPEQLFQIVPAESEVRFVVDEVLQGSPKTVIGATSQVSGRIALDPVDLDAAQLGTVMVDARTLKTDSSQRDRAIQNFVLKTGQSPYISFTPTGVAGLPDTASLGESLPVQIDGNLTIGGVTRPVTFDATVTRATADRLEGTATTAVRFADWGISIPQVPMVAGVSDTVRLEIDFAATAA